MRLNKFLSEAGVCSRREADRLIEEGRITVNGKTAQVGQQAEPGAQVLLDGRQVQRREEKVLLLFYKPVGVECTANPRVKNNAIAYLDYPVRVYYAGRLDKDSEGLLLLTNQGDLVNRIMKAGSFHEKEYLVQVDRPVTEKFLKHMAEGVPILGTVTRRCQVVRAGEQSFRIVLTQGLNRQIRRMCSYFGYQVVSLKRTRIMNLTLDGLKKGEYREVSVKERKELERLLKEGEAVKREETFRGGKPVKGAGKYKKGIKRS